MSSVTWTATDLQKENKVVNIPRKDTSKPVTEPRNFAKFTGKHLYQSLFFNKVRGLSPATLLKKRLWHRCFPVNFAQFPKTPFLQNTSGRLLLSFLPNVKIIGDKHKKLWLRMSLFGLYLFKYFLIFFMPRRFFSGL